MTDFADEEVGICAHCHATLAVSGIRSRWEKERYAACGHILPAYTIGQQAIVEDDGRFRPPFGKPSKKGDPA